MFSFQEKTIKLSLLAKKQASSENTVRLNLVGKSSERVLQLLVRFSKKLPIPLASVHECIKTLFKRFSTEKSTDVQAKIAWLIGQLCLTVGYNFDPILKDLLSLLHKESSGKVLVQLWTSVENLASKINEPELHHQLALLASESLSDIRPKVRCKCLMTIGALGSNALGTSRPHTNFHNILANFFDDNDPRTRCEALKAMIQMHHRGQKLEISIYDKACKSLYDDFEQVRFTGSQVVWILGHIYPESKIRVPYADYQIRLVDDAFAKICDLMNDSSWKVRAEAAKLLGSLHRVSDSFVFQTLNKKIMSDLRRKKSLNEQAKEGFVEEFSSGKTWADDAPVSSRDVGETTTVMNMGACGAFVHGLEDEMMEVRSASVDSLTELAAQRSNTAFAQAAVDFLVDCLNDEIGAVRLNAVNSIHKIVDQVVILEDQLDNVHSAMEDACADIRRGIHDLLSSCRLVSKACLYDTVTMLLKNMNKYPADRNSVWKTMKKLGEHHGELTYLLTAQLLNNHPFFSSSEPVMDDPNYIAVLILIFNAAKLCPQMSQLFPEYVTRHYQYLSDSIPDLVPQGIKMNTFTTSLCTNIASLKTNNNHDDHTSNKSKQFLSKILEKINLLQSQDSVQQKLILESAIEDLKRISKFAPKFTSTSQCMADFLHAQLLLYKSVDQKVWTNRSNSTSGLIKPVATRIIELTYELEYLYVGLSALEIGLILQLRFKGHALLFVLEAHEAKTLKNSGGGDDNEQQTDNVQQQQWRYGERVRRARDALFRRMSRLHSYMRKHELLPHAADSFTLACFKQLLGKSRAMKASLLIKFFQPLLANYSVTRVSFNTTVQKSRVRVDLPQPDPDTPVKFAAGLAAPIRYEATVENITHDPLHCLRIRVDYADSTSHHFPLRTSDVRRISAFKHRISTTIQLTHVKWTDPCAVRLSLVRVVTEDHQNEDAGDQQGQHRSATPSGDTNNQAAGTTSTLVGYYEERMLQIGETVSILVQTN